MNILLILLLSQEPNPLKWNTHKNIADIISTITVSTNIILETEDAFNSRDKKKSFSCLAIKNIISLTSTELVKRIVHRQRPDKSDSKSFYSGHTGLAAVNSGWSYNISIPLVVGTGYGRMAANKHFGTDVLVGALSGFAINRICSVNKK